MMGTKKAMAKVALGAMVAMSMMSAANAQDITGMLMRMAINVGSKVVERGLSSAVTAVKNAVGPKKQGDDMASGEEAAKSEAGATAIASDAVKDQAPASGGNTMVLVEGREVEVPTRLLALSAPDANKSASAEVLKMSMAGAISEQAKADRAVVLKEQTSGVPLLGQVMAPMMVPAKLAAGGAGGIMKLLALAGAASKVNAASLKKPVDAIAGNSDASKEVRAVVGEKSKEALQAASDGDAVEPGMK
jgi:hypothetical protein